MKPRDLSSPNFQSKTPEYNDGSGGTEPAKKDREVNLKDTAVDLEEKALTKIEETKSMAKQKYSEVENYIKNADLDQAVSDVRAFASRKPLTAIGLGIGFGYLLTKAIGNRR